MQSRAGAALRGQHVMLFVGCGSGGGRRAAAKGPERRALDLDPESWSREKAGGQGRPALRGRRSGAGKGAAAPPQPRSPVRPSGGAAPRCSKPGRQRRAGCALEPRAAGGGRRRPQVRSQRAQWALPMGRARDPGAPGAGEWGRCRARRGRCGPGWGGSGGRGAGRLGRGGAGRRAGREGLRVAGPLCEDARPDSGHRCSRGDRARGRPAGRKRLRGAERARRGAGTGAG